MAHLQCAALVFCAWYPEDLKLSEQVFKPGEIDKNIADMTLPCYHAFSKTYSGDQFLDLLLCNPTFHRSQMPVSRM